MADRVYSKEEADAILARAIEMHGHGEQTSHADLLGTAREIGVAPETLERAAAEVLAGRRDDKALRALRARQWRGFFAHLVPYVCVGMLLGFINVMTGGFPWAVIPMLAWGIGLASHLLVVGLPDEEKLRWRVARQRERESERATSVRASVRAPGRESSGGRLRVDTGGRGGSEDDALAAPGEAEAEAEIEAKIEKRFEKSSPRG
jgi:hypothetical protein